MALTSATGTAAPPDPSPTDVQPDIAPAAAPSRGQCLAAHHATQELRQSGKLVEAAQQLMICSSASCPGPVIADCGSWIGELEQQTPTLVFEVKADGKEAVDAKVFVDQQPVADWSQALKVNPGRHVVRAELPSFEPHEENVIVTEGRRMRLVSIQFTSPAAAPPPPPAGDEKPAPVATPSEHRPIPVVVYPALGVGVAGVAGFAVFAAIGRSKQDTLERVCAPHCTNSDLNSMKSAYLIGDIALGVGAAALVTTAVLYFTRPAQSSHHSALLSVDVGPTRGVSERDRGWRASATMAW